MICTKSSNRLCLNEEWQQVVISMISVTAHWDMSKEWEQLVISMKSGNSLLFAWWVATACYLLEEWQQLVNWQQLVIYLKSCNRLLFVYWVAPACNLFEEREQLVSWLKSDNSLLSVWIVTTACIVIWRATVCYFSDEGQ